MIDIRGFLRRGARTAAVGGLFCAAAVLSPAGAAEPQTHFTIPRQPLADALMEFARQANLQIFSPETDDTVWVAAPLEGHYAPEEALRRLLTGTGYTFVRTSDTYSIVPEKSQTPQGDAAPGGASNSAQPEKGADASSNASASGSSAQAGSLPPEIGVVRLQEVVVTAQKREQRLLEVPLSVSAFTGDAIERMGATELADFLQEAPGVTIVDSGDGNQSIVIRGIGSVNGDATVGYYLDELPFSLINLADLPNVRTFDLERVETLRGPQGTLYGAGSMGGTVRILTRNPDLQRFEVRSSLVGSSTTDGGENYQVHGAVNLPLVDGRLAFRGVASYEDWSGWVDSPVRKDVNDRRLQSYRGKLRFVPVEGLDIVLSGWFSRQEIGQSSTSLDDRRTNSTNEPQIRVDYDLFSAVVEYKAPAFSVVSATSYIDYTQSYFANLGLPTPVLFESPADNFSQEIRFASSSTGPFRWTFGGIYQDLTTDAFIGLPAGAPFFGPSLTAQSSESWAVFGEGTYAFLDGRLQATLGLRHFEDRRETVESTGLGTTGETKARFDSFSPRFNLAYRTQGGWLLYVNAAKGFRSGQTQLALPRLFDPSLPVGIDAETLWSYEVGAKADLLDGRLVVEAAAYRNEWDDLQTPVTVSVTPPFVGVINAGSASSTGFDFNVDYRPINGLTLRLNGNINDATYDEEVSDITGVIIRKGQRISGIAKHTLNASMSYSWPLGWTGGLAGTFGFVHLGAQYNSPRDSVGANSIGPGEDVTLINARVGIENDTWGLFLFGDNLTDTNHALTGKLPDAARPRPRTIGLNLTARF